MDITGKLKVIGNISQSTRLLSSFKIKDFNPLNYLFNTYYFLDDPSIKDYVYKSLIGKTFTYGLEGGK
jgi:hypothetical protein